MPTPPWRTNGIEPRTSHSFKEEKARVKGLSNPFCAPVFGSPVFFIILLRLLQILREADSIVDCETEFLPLWKFMVQPLSDDVPQDFVVRRYDPPLKEGLRQMPLGPIPVFRPNVQIQRVE